MEGAWISHNFQTANVWEEESHDESLLPRLTPEPAVNPTLSLQSRPPPPDKL